MSPNRGKMTTKRKSNRRIMRRFQLREISAVDTPAQEAALMTLLKRRVSKNVAGTKFFADDFAYVGDHNKPNTWHFLLCNRPNGKPTAKRVDAVIKAYGAMMGGMGEGMPNRYHIPDDALDSLLDKIRDAWAKAYPHRAPEEMPDEIAAEPGDELAMAEGEEDPMAGEGDEEIDPEAEEEVDPTEEEVDPAAEEVDPAAEEEEKPRPRKPAPRFAAKEYPRRKKPKPGKPKPDPEGAHAEAMAGFAMGKISKAICKYYYVDPTKGAMSFGDVLAECKKDEQYREVMEVAYPILNSLDGSLRSIVADKNLDTAAKTIMMRGSVEGFLAAIKEEWPEVEEALEKVLGINEGDDDMPIARKDGQGDATLAKQVDALTKRLDKQDADHKAALEKANAETAAANAKLALVETVAKLSAPDRAYYDALKTDEDRDAFMKMDAKGRKAAIRTVEDGDETVEIDGAVITKSAAGAAFAMLKAQAKKMADLEKRAEEDREARLNAEYLQQAADEMEHLPGTAAEKAAVLRAIDEGIEDEDVRNSLAKMLSVGNKVVGAAFDRVGTGGGEGGSRLEKAGRHEFEKQVGAIKARDNCTHTVAIQRAREEHPDAFEDWQSFGSE